MPQYQSATLNFTRDANGNPQISYTIVYRTGDQTTSYASGPFAQQILGDFFPQASVDLTQGQKDDGDAGNGIK